MGNFTGALNTNLDMILGQRVFVDDIYETKSTLLDMARRDVGMLGDQYLYYSTDVLKSYKWEGDSEAGNLLKLHRPKQPQCQTLTVNQLRIIPVTVDSYLTKQAWSTEYAFSEFNSRMLSWLYDTKRIYESMLFNTFVGTNTTLEGKQNVSLTLPPEPEGVDDYNTESYNRLVAQTIATEVANLLVDIEDVTRDYNDYGNLRSFSADSLVFVWNAEYVNKIRKLDLPTIFHKDELVDKFAEHTLPTRFFGNINQNSGTTGSANITVRSLIEKDYNEVELNSPDYDPKLHVFPGDLLPANTPYEANETYGEDPSIILKIYHKESIPFLTGFSTSTEFFNQRSLTSTHFMIWGHGTLEHIKNYPFITVKAVAGA